MKRFIIYSAAFSMLVSGLTACDSVNNSYSAELQTSVYETTAMTEKKISADNATTSEETSQTEPAETSIYDDTEPADYNSIDDIPQTSSDYIYSDSADFSSGEFTSDDLVFVYNGIKINLDEDINDVIAALGQPVDMISAPSCYYDGDDKTFVYNGFKINTYPDGNNDYVVSIELVSDSVSTVKGVSTGMKIDDALAVYGQDYTVNGFNYQYQIGDKYMYFYVQNGVISVIGIVYAN